jgi:hypothetical protein
VVAAVLIDQMRTHAVVALEGGYFSWMLMRRDAKQHHSLERHIK